MTIHGVYTTSHGVPLPAQPVHILGAPDNHTNAFTPVATVTTALNGSWTATLPAGTVARHPGGHQRYGDRPAL